LPNRYGIGDLGPSAYEFVNFLYEAGQTLWQVLPLNPTDYGNSPYQSPSAFAGNPLLISIDKLIDDGLLSQEAVSHLPAEFAVEDRVDYDAVMAYKIPLLYRSFEQFVNNGGVQSHAYTTFCKKHATWLNDYALFMALKEQFNGMVWQAWERPVALRDAATLKKWQETLATRIEFRKYLQYQFFTQWFELKAYANTYNIRIIGDIPIYVAYDSADVWASPELFKLDNTGKPTVVAGVPPDYFSADGQLWGNPIYKWDQMARKGFAWWIERLRHALSLADIVRIDHFRGLEDYWEVDAKETTARNGKWVKGPSAAFFHKLKRVFGEALPIIAEDLGEITPEVLALREQFSVPGMKVLHFAFGDTDKNPYLPHNYTSNFVVYTGTHDNNTTIGWFDGLAEQERERVQCYLGRNGSDIAWELMRLSLMSVADMAITPVQDILRLGAESRMNMPGTALNNWEWRLRSKMLNPGIAQGLRLLTTTYGRLPETS
jgi:4-alpha-glucanotransferase